jgi:hypothetical protein
MEVLLWSFGINKLLLMKEAQLFYGSARDGESRPGHYPPDKNRGFSLQHWPPLKVIAAAST